jgi:hypothetical protein
MVAADGPGAAALVARLGAPQFADREAAGRALREVGRDALPALQAAAKSKDPEVRTRSARLVEDIQRDWLTKPTRLALDFRDETVEGVIKAIDGRNGLRLAALPPLRGGGTPNVRAGSLSTRTDRRRSGRRWTGSARPGA